MEKFKNFAIQRPVLFGFVLILIYAFLATVTFPVHFLFPDNEVGQYYGDAISKLISFLVFLLILWRFGWLRISGITRPGNVWIWLVVAGLLAYKFLSELYAFTGDISLVFPNSKLAIANTVYYFPASLVEETMYRGLALTAMILAWGDTKQGQIKAILLSSLFFGIIHLFNLINRPLGVVLFQAVVVTLPGILYATIVLASRSLWPAIIIHWLTNAAVNIKITGIETYQETFTMWITFAVALIPLMAFSAYLIWKFPESYKFKISMDPIEI